MGWMVKARLQPLYPQYKNINKGLIMPFSILGTLLFRVPIPAEHQLKLLSPFVRSSEAYKNSTTAKRISVKLNTTDFHEKNCLSTLVLAKILQNSMHFVLKITFLRLFQSTPIKSYRAKTCQTTVSENNKIHVLFKENYNVFRTFFRDKTDIASTFPKFEIEESIKRSQHTPT
jgi:hypothetical protein